MQIRVSLFFLCFFLFHYNGGAQTSRTIDSLRNSLDTELSIAEELEIYYALSEEWAGLNFDSAFHYASLIQEKNLVYGDQKYQLYALRATGLAFDYEYMFDSADHYYLLALDMARSLSDTSNLATLNFHLGTVQLLRGDFVSVLPRYRRAIELLELSGGDKGTLLNIYINLGIVYSRIDRFEDAKQIYHRAISVVDESVDTQVSIDIYTNMGNVMILLNDYDSAEYYYNKVKSYGQAQKSPMDMAYAYNGLGRVEQSRGNFDTALSYFNLVLNQQDVSDVYLRFTALRYKAEILSIKGSYDSANTLFVQAEQLFAANENPDELKDLYLQLSEHHERVGNLGLSMKYLRKHYQIKDQLVSRDVINRTSEWEERYQAKERENEIINLKLQKEEASLVAAEQRNQRNIFLLLSFLLVLIVGFSFYMYRLKQKSAQELEEKNGIIHKALEDKELLMKEIHHRVKNNLQVISSLLNLQSNFITDAKANAAMLESKNRVHSMALIHQRLYQNENLTEIDLEEYLDQLIDNLQHSYMRDGQLVEIALQARPLMMDVDKVILIGLIVNELITNSFKYAFEGREKGCIKVLLDHVDGKVELSVSDNGIGMQKQPEVKNGSLGTLLIHDLSKKLKADLEYQFEEGTKVSLKFPIKSKTT